MSSARITLLLSILSTAAHPIPAQTPLDPIPAELQKACDPNYRPSTSGPIYDEPPITFSVALCERGIDTSEPSLIAALKNSDPVVRSLAAAELSEKQDHLAILAIENTLSVETNTGAKINIASSLVTMGDPVGAKTLSVMCMDATLPVEDTVQVVNTIAMLHESKPNLLSAGVCADTVLAALDSVSEDYQRMDLVSILPRIYKEVPKNKAARMVLDAQNLLESSDVTTRMRASQALADMGSTASIDPIRCAIERETDPNIRAWHQNNLDTLTRLQGQGAAVAPSTAQPQ